MNWITKLKSWLRQYWPFSLVIGRASRLRIQTGTAKPLTSGQPIVATHRGVALDFLIAGLDEATMLKKADLEPGSIVQIYTKNSVYELLVLDQNDFIVSGGWFDKKNLSPFRTGINGCTWGGSAIKHDIIATPNMYVEFANNVTTSHIRGWRVQGVSNDQTMLPE